MKKIYLTIPALLIASLGMSQQRFAAHEMSTSVAREIAPIENSVAALDGTDTLGLEDFGNTVINYGLIGGGYFFGTLSADDGQGGLQQNAELAGGFIVNDPYNVIGAMTWFSAKADASGNPAAANLKMYSLADNKAIASAASTGLDAIGPNQSLATAPIAFADIDTTFITPTFTFFTNPVWVNQDFALSVDISPLYGTPADTLALWADADGDSDGEYTWTKLNFPGTGTLWVRSSATFATPVNNHVAIFAIVAESGVGIEEQGFLNGVKMTMYPNPAVSSDNATIQYALETSVKNVDLNIYGLNGQLVYTASQGAKANGLYNVTVPAGTLSAGSYIYSIDADGKRMAKRMEILK
ncbi:MAG: T9SS type A sorting domain-containing protein [Flavobacteriales bacterium]|nr:T9SS type A sorting domain-containing protein [Flavobacteriales bacterium]